jgi:hypothetical protein
LEKRWKIWDEEIECLALWDCSFFPFPLADSLLA